VTATTATSGTYVPGQVIVGLAPGLGSTTFGLLNKLFGTKLITTLGLHSTIGLLATPSGVDAAAMATLLQSSNLVSFATTNRYVAGVDAAPYRKYGWTSSGGTYEEQPATEQAGMGTSDGGSQTLATLDLLGFDASAPEAPDRPDAPDAPATSSPTGRGVVVAVLDTGMQPDHPVLAGRLHRAAYDFVAMRSGTQDPFDGLDYDGDGIANGAAGHGTHAAGVVHLVAPGATLLPLRVLNSDGRGNEFAVAQAIDYATAKGAKVASLSLVADFESPVLRLVLRDAVNAGVLIAAAAGNEGTTAPHYPAADACAVGVTSVDPAGGVSAFANRGSWVALAAPGEEVISTFPEHDGEWDPTSGNFALWSGTSIATPFVAGQAALLREVRSSLAPWQISALIAATTRPLESADSDASRRGLIQVDRSVAAAKSGARPRASDNLIPDCAGSGGLLDLF
jgi:subtilisin family serine protease